MTRMSETIPHPERGGPIRAYASILACAALGIALPAAVIGGVGRWDVVALLGAVGGLVLRRRAGLR